MKKLYGLMFLVIMFMLVSCGGMPKINFADLTPKQKLTAMYGTYNSQYAGYMVSTGYALDEGGNWTKITTPEMSDDQKNVLVQKRKVLTEVYPLIKLYDTAVNSGALIDPNNEAQIFALLDRLATLVPD